MSLLVNFLQRSQLVGDVRHAKQHGSAFLLNGASAKFQRDYLQKHLMKGMGKLDMNKFNEFSSWLRSIDPKNPKGKAAVESVAAVLCAIKPFTDCHPNGERVDGKNRLLPRMIVKLMHPDKQAALAPSKEELAKIMGLAGQCFQFLRLMMELRSYIGAWFVAVPFDLAKD